jgi:hypothetical protein
MYKKNNREISHPVILRILRRSGTKKNKREISQEEINWFGNCSNVAQLYFIMTRIMLFSYGYARQIINNRKNAANSLAISMAMRIRRYGAERIAQYGRSRATLDAT